MVVEAELYSRHGRTMTLTSEQVQEWLDTHPVVAEDYFVRKATVRMVQRWHEARRTEKKSDLLLDVGDIVSECSDNDGVGKGKIFRFKDTVEIINSNEKEEEETEELRSCLPSFTRRFSEPHRAVPPKRQNDDRLKQFPYSRSSFFDSLDLSAASEIRGEKMKRVRSPPRLLRKTKSLPSCGQQHALGALIESKIRLPSSKGLNNASKLDLKNSDEREFFFEIVKDIANDLDLTTLSYKILVNVGILTNADRCSLFLAEGVKGKQWLVSKVFDVCVGASNSPSKDFIDHQREIRVPWGKGLVGYAAKTGETVNIPDAYAVCNV